MIPFQFNYRKLGDKSLFGCGNLYEGVVWTGAQNCVFMQIYEYFDVMALI